MRPGEMQPLWWPEVEYAYDEAESRADSQSKVGSSCCCLLPEDAQYKDGSHWRGNETKYRLEDVEEVEVLDAVNSNCKDNGYGGTYYRNDTSDVIDVTL